jgi:hypothetical protein
LAHEFMGQSANFPPSTLEKGGEMRIARWCAAVFLLVASVASAEEFSIDSFRFEWKLATVGESTLTIEKTQDATRVVIFTSGGSLSMTAAEAAAVGIALGKTGEFSKSLKGSIDKSETGKAGELAVKFLTSKDGAFGVYLSRPGRAFSRGVLLDREAAVAFCPGLRRAVEMQKYLDSKLKL